MQTYKTVRDAGIAALKLAIPLTEKSGYEYAGLIIKQDSGFTFTDPYTSKFNDSVDMGTAFSKAIGRDTSDISFRKLRSLLRKAGVVSGFHVHPAFDPLDPDYEKLGYARYSSSADMLGMMRAGFNKTYLGVAGSREIREVSPNLDIKFPVGEYGSPAALGPVIAYA